jgi:hypothetical protein
MPQLPHYVKANDLLSNVLGADAADQSRAIAQAVNQIARLLELIEEYDNTLPPQHRVGPDYDNKAA